VAHDRRKEIALNLFLLSTYEIMESIAKKKFTYALHARILDFESYTETKNCVESAESKKWFFSFMYFCAHVAQNSGEN
jgi:hypothetical protein